MDRNTIIGTVLIALFILAYFFITKPSDEEIAKQQRYVDSIQQVEYKKRELTRQVEDSLALLQQQTQINEAVMPDSVKKSNIQKEFGRYADAAVGTEQFDVLQNNKMSVTFSNKGGKPYRVHLNEYKTYYQKPLHLLAGDSTKFGLRLSEIGKSTNSLFFIKVSQSSSKDSLQSITYRLHASEFAYIEYVYTLAPDSYAVDLQIHTKGMDQYIKESRLNLYWETYMNSFEKSREIEGQNTNIVWKYNEDDVETLNAHADEPEKEELTGKVSWVGFKYQYFSAILIAKDNFERGGEVIAKPLSENDSSLKIFATELFMPKQETNAMTFYFGPNHYPTLKAQGAEIEGVLDLGRFGFITKYAIIPIFNWLNSFLTNFGLIILLLTIILKVSLFPLTFKSYLSTARMRVLKPQTEEITAKFPNPGDAMKRQQATMEMYRKAGVNPMGGCLPMLIQFPILIAMFRFFPASIELRQESFLWAEDLSSYDSIFSLPFSIPFYGDHVSLFTLLMAVSMIFVNQINMANTVTTPGMPNMKVMMWIMSIMMVFWFNSYSSGLSYYYFLANVITLLQTFIIRQMIDDKKILAKIEANKKNPKKKSSFQERLEKMAREQQKLRK
ncbi:MAG TPA: membrane protein insertase YidC [Bacteroidales bacterium]|nr:MAG: Membrane protein insertase YidC [Bacteroidetes bacterium ADurb.Bin217]HPM12255.1 membrane protein insertase YidC [Bacteroidales bacterium]